MQVAHYIRERGFRRWYERQLIESHAWLVTALLAALMALAGVEALSVREGWLEFAWSGAVAALGTWLALQAFVRYRQNMLLAGFVCDQASCAGCGRYGFRAAEGEPPLARPLRLQALCRRCGHRWQVRLEPDEPEA